MQPPKAAKKPEAFIGLIKEFRRVVLNYAVKSECNNEAREILKPFKWTKECQRAFESPGVERTSEPLVQR